MSGNDQYYKEKINVIYFLHLGEQLENMSTILDRGLGKTFLQWNKA